MKVYTVGQVVASGSVMGQFDTEDEAAAFIDTLPGHELGIYYLDGPEERKVYRIYLRHGPTAEGRYIGQEFGIDYRTLEGARKVIANYQANFPTARYFIRAAKPRYHESQP